MDPMFLKLLQGVPVVHQQHLIALPPEARAAYLNQIKNAMKQRSQPQEVKMAPIQEPQTVPQKRTRGSGPRKCNNPSCDKIVTKRNFCYKCQKRKERGLPLGPRLPSVKQLLLPTDTAEAPANNLPMLSVIEPNSNQTQPVFSQLVQLHQQSQSYPELVTHMNLQSQAQSLAIPKSYSENHISDVYRTQGPSPFPSPLAQIKAESSPEKLAQLHQYLVGLAGSEESAADLVRDYITQIPVKNETKFSFTQQQQQPGSIPGIQPPLRYI